MRNLFSALCCVLAALCATAGVMFHYVETLADTPEPAREIVGPIANDKNIIDLLPERILGAALDQSNLQNLIPDFMKDGLRQSTDAALKGALENADFKKAWLESIDLTRSDYITRLDMVHSGEITYPAPNFGEKDTRGPTIVMQARPFATLGVQSLDGILRPLGLAGVLDGIRDGASVQIPLNIPDPTVVSPKTLASWLAVSRGWAWFFVGAGVLVIAGVLLGRGRGRAVSVLIGAATMLLLSRWVATWASDARGGGDALGMGGNLDPLASLIRDRMLAGLASHLDIRAEWLWNAGLVGAGVGVVLLIIMILVSSTRVRIGAPR